MFQQFLKIMNMGITYGGKKGTRRVKAKKQQKQSNFQNPFGDAFKELTKTVKISRIKTDEAMLILNFEKNEIPTVDEINERFTTFYNMNDSTEQGSVYLQSKIKKIICGNLNKSFKACFTNSCH